MKGLARFENEDKFEVYHLSEIGVEFDKKGEVSFKEDKFQKALEKDYEGIAEAISGENGFVSQLKAVMDGYAQPGSGVISARENGING